MRMHWRAVFIIGTFVRTVLLRRPPLPVNGQDTPHERCLRQIDRLERELADDGVLFLQSETEFDREVAAATTKRLEQAPVIAPPPRPRMTGRFAPAGDVRFTPTADGCCRISGQPVAACPCDPRWAQIYYCPKSPRLSAW